MKDILLPSPLDFIDIVNDQDICFYVKRDDLIHEDISGNKWRKLKYQIKELKERQKDGVITFGGAFSNHIVATAAACGLNGLKSVGIIRGEMTALNNPSLLRAQSYGMTFHFVSRAAYRLKENSHEIGDILSRYPKHQLIPEGGHHKQALIGVGDIVEELKVQAEIDFDYLLCSVGTGTTFAGFSQSFSAELIGINALKNGSIVTDICRLLDQPILPANQHVLHDFHFGGYAKHTAALIDYMHHLYDQYDVKTDVIYTAKLFFAAQELLQQQYFKPGSRVVIYHSGGLQGNAGMNYRFPDLIKFA